MRARLLGVALIVLPCPIAAACDATVPVTAGHIAVTNLDHAIARSGDDAAGDALLLARARFLADDEALARVAQRAERVTAEGDTWLRRARARAAAHRFAQARQDLAEARRLGADPAAVDAALAGVEIATGRAGHILAQLELRAASEPGFATHGALASAYAALGRFDEADRHYGAARAALTTTSPLPFAWIAFARGLMWAEAAGDAARGEHHYREAIACLPRFVAAQVHLAEIEHARGHDAAARARLQTVLAGSAEPEALALLGVLQREAGEYRRGTGNIRRAHRRFQALLRQQPLAFADHAARFYLGPGADPQRALALARVNRQARDTEAARELLRRAASAAGVPFQPHVAKRGRRPHGHASPGCRAVP